MSYTNDYDQGLGRQHRMLDVVAELPAETRQQAIRYVLSVAHDAPDAARLLAMLGLSAEELT